MLPKGVPKDSLIPRLTLEPTGRQIALEWMLRARSPSLNVRMSPMWATLSFFEAQMPK
jgi:hypothetical protein